MDKIGHLSVTGSVSEELYGMRRLSLLAGSVLPDFMVHTYVEGHTWEATFEKIMQQLTALERTGRNGLLSYLRLGWILHYVEDYFTYPHNTIFEGTLAEHYAYEKRMTRWMRDGGLQEMDEPLPRDVCSAGEIRERLQKYHDSYLSSEMSYDNDILYMRQVVSEILSYYEQVFAGREAYAEFAPELAMQVRTRVSVGQVTAGR